MTLKELLNETIYQEINYYPSEDEKSIISDKAIKGFPDRGSRFPVDNNYIFNVVKLDDGSYEFYVGDHKATKGAPYKFKDCYIGTLKNFSKFKDAPGIALECIRRFISSNRLNDKKRKYLLNYYNNTRKHPYYTDYFKDLILKEEEEVLSERTKQYVPKPIKYNEEKMREAWEEFKKLFAGFKDVKSFFNGRNVFDKEGIGWVSFDDPTLKERMWVSVFKLYDVINSYGDANFYINGTDNELNNIITKLLTDFNYFKDYCLKHEVKGRHYDHKKAAEYTRKRAGQYTYDEEKGKFVRV